MSDDMMLPPESDLPNSFTVAPPPMVPDEKSECEKVPLSDLSRETPVSETDAPMETPTENERAQKIHLASSSSPDICQIQGVVHNRWRLPLVGRTVKLYLGEDETGAPVGSAITNLFGRFRFTRLKIGTYTLAVSDGNRFVCQAVTLCTEECIHSDIVLRL